MSFTSVSFIFFYTAVCIFYYLISPCRRWIFLLGVSYLFYGMWHPVYLLFLGICTLGNYIAGIGIHASEGGRRNAFLIIGIAAGIGVLFSCRYIDFLNRTLGSLLSGFGLSYDISMFPFLMPLGVSFYTLQALSYSIDIYRNQRDPEYHLGVFAIYVSFFPQLLAGPIERSDSLLPQFRVHHAFDAERATIASRWILWGFFKKLVVADRLGAVVDTVYGNPASFEGIPLLIATYLFSFQIYCDFSAYTDIARGTAKMMGFDLTENFRRPYLATSITDFWRRWHISLSTWIRDYIYIPLGGRYGSKPRRMLNLAVAFLLSGLWHGANWRFALWGLLHALFVALERAVKVLGAHSPASGRRVLRGPIRSLMRWVLTYHCVLIGWVFFRSADFSQAVFILRKIFSQPNLSVTCFPGMDPEGVVIILVSLACVWLVDMVREFGSLGYRIPRWPTPVRWGVYALGVWAVFLYGWMKPYTFIYFVF